MSDLGAEYARSISSLFVGPNNSQLSHRNLDSSTCHTRGWAGALTALTCADLCGGCAAGVHGVSIVAMPGSLIRPPRLELLQTPNWNQTYRDVFLDPMMTHLSSHFLGFKFSLVANGLIHVLVLISSELLSEFIQPPHSFSMKGTYCLQDHWNNERR